MTSAEQKKFIADIAPVIQDEAKRRSYFVCSAVIAQACIESKYGQSSLGYKYHNYFGLKCGKAWRGPSVNMKTKEEYTVGTLTTIKDNFRVYSDMTSGVSGYYDFISTSRYATLKSARTAQEYLERIKAAGYATSSTYVNTNMNVVRKYDLIEWDKPLNGIIDLNPYSVPASNLKQGSSGIGVKWLQWELNQRGYGLKVDGIYGPRTTTAVRDYQAKNKLEPVDGIVGPVTRNALLSGEYAKILALC